MDFTKNDMNSYRRKRKYFKSLICNIFKDLLQSYDFDQKFDIDVEEIICTNPSCQVKEPHTFIYITWSTGGFGSFTIPLSISKIDKNVCSNFVPNNDIMRMWSKGIKVDYPVKPFVRFTVGTMVLCKIRDEGILHRDWVYGKISQLHYKEEDWSPLYTAPYQIKLSNGSYIYADRDSDDLIRAVSLRFKVGDRVSCYLCNRGLKSQRGWNCGKIVRLFYYESNWPVENVAPYQVLLQSGELIYVPIDHSSLICKRCDPVEDAPTSPCINFELFEVKF